MTLPLQSIGLCSNTTSTIHKAPNGLVKLLPAKHQNLVGDKKCTYGPAYWCASVENAKKCGVSGTMFPYTGDVSCGL